jgi:hypothetical protein
MINFGRCGSVAARSSSRWPKSLWRKIVFSQWAWRTPSIIELWFRASDSKRQFGISFARVEMPVSFDT